MSRLLILTPRLHTAPQSLPVAVVAVSWMVFTMVVFMFPPAPDPTATEMNYTVVVLGGTVSLSLVYFYFPKYGGVYWFQGPVANIAQDEDMGSKEGDTYGPEEKDVQLDG